MLIYNAADIDFDELNNEYKEVNDKAKLMEDSLDQACDMLGVCVVFRGAKIDRCKTCDLDHFAETCQACLKEYFMAEARNEVA